MSKSDAEREVLLAKIPEKTRRERQQRLVKLGLDAPDVADSVSTYRRTIIEMEETLGDGDWLLGDSFSLADICLAPYFQTLLQFNWTQLFAADCPRVAAWFARCQERPSYQSAVADDFPPAVIRQLQDQGEAVWGKIACHLE